MYTGVFDFTTNSKVKNNTLYLALAPYLSVKFHHRLIAEKCLKTSLLQN